jgi:uncharacterized membrane protein/nitrite reductase/ring-hydroxylating ferredoxin subunit
MKSRAHLKSHPLHPILVSFPIAFFVGAFVFDLLAYGNSREDVLNTAVWMNLAGCCMAVVAAIPGFIDFLKAVPPESSAKKRAATHGSINVTVLILFLIAYWLRDDAVDHTWIIAIEGVGVVLLMVAGWMGGTLVYRNQLGVDIRYANAGKWRELDLDEVNSISMNDVQDLRENQLVLLRKENRRFVLSKTSDAFAVFEDRCTHRGGSLAGGSMICGTVQCPWHGSQFDVTSGTVKAGPAKQPIKTFPTRVNGDRLQIDIK